MEHSLSVIVPALNEEGNIAGTVDTVSAALMDKVGEFEILIFDDGSQDRTGPIADELAAKFPYVRAFHNPERRGLGYNYRRGVEEARCEFCVMVPGDNELPAASLQTLVDAIGKADIINCYFLNPWVRPMSRRIVSRIFVAILNVSFGLKLKYYNGHNVIKTELLRSIPIETDGHAYAASIMVRLLRRGISCHQVALLNGEREYGKSNAFNLKNIWSVGKTMTSLFFAVHFKGAHSAENSDPAPPA